MFRNTRTGFTLLGQASHIPVSCFATACFTPLGVTHSCIMFRNTRTGFTPLGQASHICIMFQNT
ncbi:MAG: hypothetical protein NXY57DRAFT_970602 [Lentinula lateritia]|nr:MAG: hypothetical protein NXY57DRAFT_970602 [Lentinula lateritia]